MFTSSRHDLIILLERYTPWDEEERAMIERTIGFLGSSPDCFDRQHLSGHITASSWIIDSARGKVLLTHHAKLARWLQLGGHCDGRPDVLEAALREAGEESGLERLCVVERRIFDVDIHTIPVRGIAEPEHFHYDIRFLLEGDSTLPLRVTSESKALEWVAMEAVAQRNSSRSVLRMVEKCREFIR